MHIVIDGYNLIRHSRHLAEAEQDELQTGRKALIEMLAAYKKVKGHRITVVFDGCYAPVGMPRRDRDKGIDLHYSPPGVLADAIIKRIATREREGVLVVSSDQEIVVHARSVGAATVSSAQFEERLAMAGYFEHGEMGDPDDMGGWRPTTQKKGPSRRLAKNKRRNRKRVAKL